MTVESPGDPAPADVRSVEAGPPKRSSWSLALRLVSSAAFIPLLILLAKVGHFAFWALVAVEVSFGLFEFYQMMRARGLRPYRRLGIGSGLALLWVCWRPSTPHVGFLITSVVLLVLGLELRRPEAHRRVEDIAVTCFGVLYVGWLSAHLVLLRELPWRAGTAYEDGMRYVLLAFLLTWSCDTGAYVFGRLFGRTRPWGLISPRKSLEGSLGGLVCATLAGPLARVWFAPFLSLPAALALGALVGVFAQVGDLVESLLKRDAQHGDSSDLIPGHGGILDRFDSLFFGAPVTFYFLTLIVFRLP